MRPSCRSGAEEHRARTGPFSQAASTNTQPPSAYARRPPRKSPTSTTRARVVAHANQTSATGPTEATILDAERPIMLKRRRRGEQVGVRATRPQEAPVRDVGDCGEAVDTKGARRLRIAQCCGHRRRDDQTRDRGGTESPDPPRVELAQR